MNADSLKLTAYFGERQRTGDRLVASALLDLYGRHAIATSILLRGTEGFGRHHRLRTDSSLSLSEDLPAVAIAVDARPRIEALLDEATDLVGAGLITLERARMQVGDLAPVELPEELNEATKLTVYLGRQERADGVPAFVAICDLLHRRGIAGATALLGVDGTAHGQRERARFFARNAAVPMMVIAVGAGDRIAGVLPELGGLLSRPLVTLERVRVCKRDGQLIAPTARAAGCRRARPAAGPEADHLHLRGAAARRPADSPRDRAGAAQHRRERRDDASRRLGIPRRPRAAR